MVIIRNAVCEDAAPLSALIESVARRFCFNPAQQVPAWFQASVTPTAVAECIASAEYRYWVAERDRQLLGMIAMRNANHIHHLFVLPQVHGQGIAGRLWARAKAECSGVVTLRSSLYAVPVYERFGFVKSGPQAEKDGLAYQPMEWCMSCPTTTCPIQQWRADGGAKKMPA